MTSPTRRSPPLPKMHKDTLDRTSRGVNKYNVHEYHQYYCTDDSLDIPDNQINDLFRDSQGRLWVVTVNGTSLYTDKDNFQNIPLDFPNKNGIQILENKDGKIFLNMMHNLAVYNPQTHKFDVPIKIFDPNYTFNNRCFIDQSNKLWAVTHCLCAATTPPHWRWKTPSQCRAFLPPTSSCRLTESYGWLETAR